jgi:hypothetical protein
VTWIRCTPSLTAAACARRGAKKYHANPAIAKPAPTKTATSTPDIMTFEPIWDN